MSIMFSNPTLKKIMAKLKASMLAGVCVCMLTCVQEYACIFTYVLDCLYGHSSETPWKEMLQR